MMALLGLFEPLTPPRLARTGPVLHGVVRIACVPWIPSEPLAQIPCFADAQWLCTKQITANRLSLPASVTLDESTSSVAG